MLSIKKNFRQKRTKGKGAEEKKKEKKGNYTIFDSSYMCDFNYMCDFMGFDKLRIFV